jgi:diacylglycerol O-acyltransferase
MDLSVCVCPDTVPAVNDIATGIVDSVGILVAATQNLHAGNAPQFSPR